jgi:hypothetical protein
MVHVWPDLLARELRAALLLTIVLVVFALVVDAPLEDPADPNRTPNPARAPWYFVGLQELLTYFDPWIAGVVLPLIIVFGLCAIPYLDPNRAGHGRYALRERPLATAIFLTGVAGWFVLIAIGMWFRGPGWAWVWPGADPAPGVVARAWSLPNAVGAPLVLGYFLGGGAWIVRRTAGWGMSAGRRWIFALLLLAMAGTLIKILLRLAFGLGYFVSFPAAGLNL